MKVLLLTTSWPTPENPSAVPFLVREVESLRAAGVEIELFHFRGGLSPQNYMRARRQLRQHLRNNHYDLLHAQFGQSGLLALFPKPLPLVVTFQGSDINGIVGPDGRQTPRGLLLRLTSKIIARQADEIILVSAAMAQHLPHTSYHVIPGGLDLELFKPIPKSVARSALGLAGVGRYILFAASRTNPIKRYPLAREAIALVPGAQLLVAEGVTPDQIPLYMNAADALLLTSTREGSPNVVKEALACNLPVVSVDVGDVAVRLKPIDGCIVCEDDSPETIAAALNTTIQNPPSILGRESVQSISLSATAQKIISVYQRALSKGEQCAAFIA